MRASTTENVVVHGFGSLILSEVRIAVAGRNQSSRSASRNGNKRRTGGRLFDHSGSTERQSRSIRLHRHFPIYGIFAIVEEGSACPRPSRLKLR